MQLADGRLRAADLLGRQIPNLLQALEIAHGHIENRHARLPQLGNVRDIGLILDDRGVGYIEASLQRVEGYPDALLLEVRPHHLLAFKHGIERGQPLLAIDNRQRWGTLVLLGADGLVAGVRSRFPEQQVANRITTIERVEEVADIDVRPDEGPLDLRKPDFA